ncbi:MAG TPA: hypothetical protein VJI75_03725 [Candidatus Nanoarchaeia archaeon]|nr:hypothetical protein [Candidatus Nanoarchaeia archaeon]
MSHIYFPNEILERRVISSAPSEKNIEAVISKPDRIELLINQIKDTFPTKNKPRILRRLRMIELMVYTKSGSGNEISQAIYLEEYFNKRDAYSNYKRISKKLEEGKYKIILHTNGSLEIQFF